MALKYDRFSILHIYIPLGLLILASIIIELFDLDAALADFIYSTQGGVWTLKNAWITETIIHKGGRTVSILLALVVLVLLIASYIKSTWTTCRKPLLYLFLAAALSSLLVSFFKSILGVSCPWEFARYGGELLYHSVIGQLFIRDGEGCFPAGHASAGYSWVAFYFVGLYYQSRWRWLGLILPLVTGLVFGGVQQIRGAHFISHDLWTLAICWFFSLTLYQLTLAKHSTYN